MPLLTIYTQISVYGPGAAKEGNGLIALVEGWRGLWVTQRDVEGVVRRGGAQSSGTSGSLPPELGYMDRGPGCPTFARLS